MQRDGQKFTKVPTDRPPKRERLVPMRWEARGSASMESSERIAFEIDGPRIKRVPLADSIKPGMHWWWWTESPQTDIMTYPHHGRLHIELSRDVLDGSRESVSRLGKALGIAAASAPFLLLYTSLLAMVQPRLADHEAEA